MFCIGVDIDIGCGGSVNVGADTIYVVTKLEGLLAFLCLALMLTLMSALVLVFFVGDGTTNIITCLPVASFELPLIFIRERWRETWQPE